MPVRPPRQLPPPPDTGAADAGTLVDIGVLDSQPQPPPQLDPAVEMSTVLPLA